MKTIYALEGYLNLHDYILFPAETEKTGSSKPDPKASYKNLRQKTIAPDSVETLRMWKRGHRYGPCDTAKVPKVPPSTRKRKSEVPSVPS